MIYLLSSYMDWAILAGYFCYISNYNIFWTFYWILINRHIIFMKFPFLQKFTICFYTVILLFRVFVEHESSNYLFSTESSLSYSLIFSQSCLYVYIFDRKTSLAGDPVSNIVVQRLVPRFKLLLQLCQTNIKTIHCFHKRRNIL